MLQSGIFKGPSQADREKLTSKQLISFDFIKSSKKMRFNWKKGLRVPRDNLRTPFTGGAEALDGTPSGTTERC
ncbi:hypothetical protein, partial [Thalassovita mangrovi]|uniref:hypothetical protein n=1 Tax=Thalassovita mangrovi TaxID=2692236 RepID=UPI001BB2E85E